MIKITEIKKEDMPVSCWSGGTTTEIFICPRGAKYAERDFLFRISTATVELDESDFTSLPDYERLIASLDGEMLLTHNGSDGARIVPLETVYRFDGGEATHCVGRARDLNLMIRKGAAGGDMRFVADGETAVVPLKKGETALVYSVEGGFARLAECGEDDFLIFVSDGVSALFTVKKEA